MRIKFLRNEVYRAGNCPSFKAGQVVDEADLRKVLALDEAPTEEFARAWLNRWVQRGVAQWDDGPVKVRVDSLPVDVVGEVIAKAADEVVAQFVAENEPDEPQKKRGRPAGSKNKPKAED